MYPGPKSGKASTVWKAATSIWMHSPPLILMESPLSSKKTKRWRNCPWTEKAKTQNSSTTTFSMIPSVVSENFTRTSSTIAPWAWALLTKSERWSASSMNRNQELFTTSTLNKTERNTSKFLTSHWLNLTSSKDWEKKMVSEDTSNYMRTKKKNMPKKSRIYGLSTPVLSKKLLTSWRNCSQTTCSMRLRKWLTKRKNLQILSRTSFESIASVSILSSFATTTSSFKTRETTKSEECSPTTSQPKAEPRANST